MITTKRKRKPKPKRSAAEQRRARIEWSQGRGRYDAAMPAPPTERPCDAPGRIWIAVAALVPRSADVDGHEERMAAHCARAEREGAPDFCRRSQRMCEACGHVGPRGPHSAWACRPRSPDDGGAETYCRPCFARWGWPELAGERERA